jgi:hypothetical protein
VDTVWTPPALCKLKKKISPPEAHHTLNGWNITFVNHLKYLSVIFDKRIALRLYIEVIEAKAIRIYCSTCKIRFCTPLETFQGMYIIIQQNCAGNKQKSYKIMRMNMFVV